MYSSSDLLYEHDVYVLNVRDLQKYIQFNTICAGNEGELLKRFKVKEKMRVLNSVQSLKFSTAQ
jgi:hypothetical protein